MNPGGPLPGVKEYQSQATKVSWTEIFDWEVKPHRYRPDLQPVEQELRDQIEAELLRSIINDVLFAGGSRDFESLRLGHLWINDSGPSTLQEYTAASVIRMLAKKFRWTPESDGRLQVPEGIRRYLKAVGTLNGFDVATLQSEVLSLLGDVVDQWLVRPSIPLCADTRRWNRRMHRCLFLPKMRVPSICMHPVASARSV